MQRTLYFKYCQYDAVPLNSQDTEYHFFEESEQQDESVTLMTEDAAIKWLMTNNHFRKSFMEDFLGPADQIMDFYGLQRPFTEAHRMPGNIDLLLVDPMKGSLAVAFECKNVKAVSYDGDRKSIILTK